LAATGKSAPPTPYPRSTVIRELKWHWETYTNAAIGSDLWPITWGPDGNLYSAWGDGGGFGGGDHDGRVAMGIARLEGIPPHWRGVNVNGGKNPEHPASFPRKGKTGGLLFVNTILYALVNLQDGVWPDVNHALEWSTDFGATWSKADWLFAKGRGIFQPGIFLNGASNYSGLPASAAGYAYIYGAKHFAAPKPDLICLARVPTDRLKDHAAYEYFQGADGNGQAQWTANQTQAGAVFHDPNGDGVGSVVYAPALKRYLLGTFHGGPGQVSVFEGPTPWGPWSTICYLENFGGMGADGEGLILEFPQKWMSADGLTLWCVFSCYGGSAKQGIHAHDRFNLIQATLEPCR
jgi:hypothetical protein